jgi:hypothetical protein
MPLHYAIDPIKLTGVLLLQTFPKEASGPSSFLIGPEEEIDRLTAAIDSR